MVVVQDKTETGNLLTMWLPLFMSEETEQPIRITVTKQELVLLLEGVEAKKLEQENFLCPAYKAQNEAAFNERALELGTLVRLERKLKKYS